MLIRTLTRCCGRLTFDFGEQMNLPEADATELIAAGAAISLEVKASSDVETEEGTPTKPKASKAKKG